MHYNDLDWRQFEILCGGLLAAEGYSELSQFGKPGMPDRGIDWIFISPDGKRGIAQVKHSRRTIFPTSVLRNIISDLRNGMSLLNSEKAILMLSFKVNSNMLSLFQTEAPFVEIWDAETINSLLLKHHQLQTLFQDLGNAQLKAELFLEKVVSTIKESDPANELIRRIDSIEPGAKGWRDYENVCIDILNYVFIPPLRLPRIQSKTEDGLDRRDAIYPIGGGNIFWDSIKYDFSSRMMVAEFKNYVDPIGQGEVESLQQYLLPKAKRSFGLLCSRVPPSNSALKARRRAWMVAENIILFADDNDLKEMIKLRSAGENPEPILDSQLDEFFVTLAP